MKIYTGTIYQKKSPNWAKNITIYLLYTSYGKALDL
jgi:hypothetical protein